MSHPFGDLLLQFRARKRGLSQTRLAQMAGYDPAILTRMCAGKKDLTGPSGRDRVVRVIDVLHDEGALTTLDEANALLSAADMPPLYDGLPVEAAVIRKLNPGVEATQVIAQPTPRGPRHNLPAQLTSFIGRADMLADLKGLVAGTRLLTLTGAGGVGKTRLAMEAAARVVERFPDGVWFVDLAPLSNPALVPQTVGMVLGAHAEPGRPMLATLVERLRDRELLLLLDNCEHLIEAVACLADALLRDCPAVRILATSRQGLGITGERTWRVPMLQTPEAYRQMELAELAQIEAARLFIERAALASPAFALTAHNAPAVRQIVIRLDGMPLAIELAAARVKLLSADDVAARLDDRFRLLTGGSRTALPRQQTLRRAIDWSYELLGEAERVLFRRLAVFAGGWTLAAAEAVCAGEGIEPDAVLDVLTRLVDQSLVVAVTSAGGAAGLTHFGMLETLREYALKRLETSGEAEAVRGRHAAFFVALAERIQPDMSDAERKGGYARFDAEQDNFRAALGWALETNQAEPGLRLAGALGDYWFWWAEAWHEGWSWISQFLALPEANRPVRARANALKAAVNLLRYLGDDAQAERIGDETLALFRALGDKAGIARVLADMGPGACARADFALVEAVCTESVALFQEIDDQRGLAWALTWLAAAACDQGHDKEAAEWIRRGLSAAQTAGDDAIVGQLQLMLGDLAYGRKDFEQAVALQHLGMDLCRKGGDADGAYFGLMRLGRTTLAQGNIELAASQFQECETRLRQTHQKETLCWVLHQLAYVKHLQGNGHETVALLHEALTLQQRQQRKRLLIESLERCAWVAADVHQPQRAARLFGAAEAARTAIGAPLPLGDTPMYDRHLAQVRADLDETTFNAVWAEGRTMTFDEAVEYALTAH